MSRFRLASLFLFPLFPVLAAAQTSPPQVSLLAAGKVLTEPFSGRLFVIFYREPIPGDTPRQDWFKPHPFFAQDVVGLQAEKAWRFEPTVGLPAATMDLKPGKYHVQAVLDRDLGGQHALSSAGNLYSKPLEVTVGEGKPLTVTLTVDQVIPAKKFGETERIKLVDIPSPLLSRFHGKPMRLRAGVLLPASYGAADKRTYPIVYEIPGFSGDHHHIERAEKRNATDVAGVEMIHVMLDATCRLGHHTFADSANNGPVGQALIEELIPHIEKRFRAAGVPASRFVTGHSSGGWASLWLQVAYPDFFGGCWSTAPDSVDFRDFQMVNIYEKGVSVLFDAKGKPRPLGRKEGKPFLYYKPFSDMEVVFGRGGQLFSFEAVFSPKGKDDRPRPLYDRKSGLVDPAVAQAWKKYDFSIILRENWKTLGSKLAGKIHIYMGDEDTYYLDGGTRLLQKTLKELGGDAVVEIFPGKDHSSLMTAELRQRIAREMAEASKRATSARMDATDEDVRLAVARSLPFLETEGVAWMKGRGCMSCHNFSFAIWSHLEARRRGIKVDDAKLTDWIGWAREETLAKRAWFKLTDAAFKKLPGDGFAAVDRLAGLREKPFVTEADFLAALGTTLSAQETIEHGPLLVKHALQPRNAKNDGGSVDALHQLMLGGAAYGGKADDAWLGAMTEVLVKWQESDGGWKAAGQLPRLRRSAAEGNETTTAWTVLALADRPGADVQKSLAAALGRLKGTKPGPSIESLAVRLLLERKLGDAEKATALLAELRKRQNADGGWSWLPGGPSDPFSTGQTLYALRVVEVSAKDDAVRRGRQFLIEKQDKDGSWLVPPQHISASSDAGRLKRLEPIYRYWGTGWASIGLSMTLPARK